MHITIIGLALLPDSGDSGIVKDNCDNVIYKVTSMQQRGAKENP